MKGTIKIEFEGDNCLNCPFRNSSGPWYECFCSAVEDEDSHSRLIQSYVEYPSELGPRPDWCPIKIEEN